MNFSKRTGWNTEINPLSQQFEILRNHPDLINLTVSNPTECGFAYLNNGLLAALHDPLNLQYEPDAHGLLCARNAVIHYYAQKGITLAPEQIFITASTSEAYTFVFRILLEAGDKILGPAPGYPLMDYLAEINDAVLERYPLALAENGWCLDREAFGRMPQAKALLAVHPSNPAGNYVNAGEQALMQHWAAAKHAAVISDEVFYDFSWQGAPAAPSFAAQNSALTFTLSGISKILGLPQMKLSWIVVTGPETLRREAIRRLEIVADTYLSASTPVQRAFPAWMAQAAAIQHEILERLRTNRRFLETALKGSSRMRVLPGEGGWTAVLKMDGVQSDEAWTLALLEKAKVLAHPGYLYDIMEENTLVLSLLIEPGRFQEGVRRLKEWV